MATRRATADSTAIAILAKAPIPGFAKTRLIGALGTDGAAKLQQRLIERAVETAVAAAAGPVVVWAAPDEHHPVFQSLQRRFDIAFRRQPEGDIGTRMLAAFRASRGPAIVIGTDCPVLTPDHLRDAAAALHGHDAIVIPADDGGYVLIGLQAPQPALFRDIDWGSSIVMAETRWLLSAHGLTWRELPPLWDVDRPEDLPRLEREQPALWP